MSLLNFGLCQVLFKWKQFDCLPQNHCSPRHGGMFQERHLCKAPMVGILTAIQGTIHIVPFARIYRLATPWSYLYIVLENLLKQKEEMSAEAVWTTTKIKNKNPTYLELTRTAVDFFVINKCVFDRQGVILLVSIVGTQDIWAFCTQGKSPHVLEYWWQLKLFGKISWFFSIDASYNAIRIS